MTWNSNRTQEERNAVANRWREAGRKKHAAVPFLESGQWNWARNKTIMKHGNRCQKCKAEWSADNPIQVDHIKPRSKYKDLEMNLSNLQVLCKRCNHEKGNWDETDWRRK